MFVSAVASAANWTRPEIQGSELQDGGKYYIYNVEAGKYMKGMVTTHSWATTCGLATDGLLVTMTDTGAGWTIQRSDNKYTFMSGPDECHVDMASQGHNYFDVNKLPNGNYTIGITVSDDTYGLDATGESFVWGYQPQAAVPAHIYCNSIAGTDGVYTEWKFVEESEYNELSGKIATYEAALSLEAALNDIDATYPMVDVADEKAVYENLESTKEQIDAAIASVKAKKAKAVAEEAEANASYANPIDMTASIVNSTFDKQDDYSGWLGTGFGSGGTKSTCAERYNMTYDTWQELTNMPAGVYMVNVDGFYRAGSTAADFVATQKGTDNNALLYGANMVEGSQADVATSPIMHLFAGIEPGEHFDIDGTSLVGTTYTDENGDTYYAANSMLDFTNYNGTTATVEKPFYKTNKVMFPATSGTLRIGIKKDVKIGDNDWTIVDNFGLTYYGNGADAWQALWDDVKKNASVDNIAASQSVKETFKSATQAEVSNYENYQMAMSVLSASKADVDANAAAWVKYNDLINRAKLLQEDPQYMDVMTGSELAEYLDYDAVNPDDNDLDVAAIEAEMTKVQGMYDEVVSGTPMNTDMTKLLTNTDFSKGWDGWTHTGTGGNFVANAGTKCAEAWNVKDFDVYQEVANAPAGLYEIQVQGFYRHGNAGEAGWLECFYEDGTPKAKAEWPKSTAWVYMNDALSDFPNVYDVQIDNGDLFATEGLAGPAPYVDPLGIKWFANDMTNGGLAFDQGYYQSKAYSLVANNGDPLRIGVKGSTDGFNWVIFTRFKLVYKAYDEAILSEILEEKREWLEGLASAKVFDDVKTKAEGILADLDNSISSQDGKVMAGTLEEIYKLQTLAIESEKAYTEYAAAATSLEENIGIYENEADEALMNEAGTLLNDMQMAMEYIEGEAACGITTEQAKEQINNAGIFVKKLALPSETAIANASDDQPADVTGFIVNPSFETGDLTGWTKNDKATGDTNSKPNSDATYTMNNCEGSYLFNTWNSSAVEGGFWVAQTVKADPELFNVPAGTYRLTCLVASDKDNQFEVSVNDNDIAKVTTTDKGEGVEVEVIFELANENDEINIKVAGETWFKADAFHLYYHGTESELTPTAADVVTEAITSGVAKVMKFVKDGKIVIVKDGKTYTVAGAQVK